MHFLIDNCYSFEGYHLVETLLEEGHEVSGIHSSVLSNKEAHLSMYLGRHALFEEGIQEKDYAAYVTFFGEGEKQVSAHRRVNLQYDKSDDTDTDAEVRILLPILYGKWMPRDTDTLQWEGKTIPFDDAFFRAHALPIQSVMQTVSKLLAGDTRSKNYRFYAKDVCPEQEDQAVIAFTRNLQDDLITLHQHYAKFSQFYK
ncbi:hypothetical protein [Terribacillus sp. DMT04]|uniref:hypothetical protein n=1 Tax=Terribacillus sp. DMT04 TaxID=2850441 RepID=UPI001C2C48DB|nr:hypothetical protein [Terribacillus sp. DMT04]QXE02711.1 hypothetical protein KS242_05880 [Terribacillus sp. DMT04]